MAGTGGQSLRDFLKGQSEPMHREWKQKFYDLYKEQASPGHKSDWFLPGTGENIMGIIYQLFVSLTDEGGAPRSGATGVLASFASHQRPEGKSFCFANADDAAQAAAQAEMLHLPFEYFYQFLVHAEDIHDYPGYDLSLDVVEPLLIGGQPNITALSGVQIAKDFEAEQLWLDTSARTQLQRSAMDFRLKQVDSGWYVIESMLDLPGAIWIPKPVFVSPNVVPAGTYVVQSDGRDCLAYKDALFLQQNGICRATHIGTPNGDYVVRPRYLVSPILLEEMIKQRIRGVGTSLVPLIDADRAIALISGENTIGDD